MNTVTELETLPEVTGVVGLKWRKDCDQMGYVKDGVAWEVFRDRDDRLVRQRASNGELRSVVAAMTGRPA